MGIFTRKKEIVVIERHFLNGIEILKILKWRQKYLKKFKNQNLNKFYRYWIMKTWNACWITYCIYFDFSCNTAVGVFKKGWHVNDAYYNIMLRINFNGLCMENKYTPILLLRAMGAE